MTKKPSLEPITASIPLQAGVTDALLAEALETVSEGSLITDAERNTIYSNSAFTNITGYRADEIIGANCKFLQGPDTSPDEVQRIRDALNEGRVFQGTILNYRKDGSSFWNHLTITPLHDEHGQVSNFVSVQRDVTDIMEERERLSYEASHDALTGLPNRAGTRRLVRQALQGAAERGAAVAIGTFDIDHFKQINDAHGHPGGDEVLIEFSRRVSSALRRGDHVTRAGGDEFALIVSDLDPAQVHQQLDEITRRIRSAMAPPIVLESGAEVLVTSSMGIAIFPEDGIDIRSLYAAADRALYRVKARRGSDDWWELATPRVDRVAVARGQVDAAQPGSDDEPFQPEGQLTMFMQPIVDLKTGAVTQLEALARILRPDGSIMMPDQFIPHYNQQQLRELFWTGLHQSLEWVARWQKLGRDLCVSLNVPPELFVDVNSVQLVVDALELAGVDSRHLSLELLETREVELTASNTAVNELVRLGVKLHLDDISSGYSTLKRVAELPFDVIKVDRHIFDSVRTRALQVITVLAAITKLGQDFGYGVTIEGIESRERLEVSMALGAHFGQGFLFARPMPANEVAAWLDAFEPPSDRVAITTALGALAYHWEFTRKGEVHHPPRNECPLTAYFDGLDPQVVALHDQLHKSGKRAIGASALITSWLLDEISRRD